MAGVASQSFGPTNDAHAAQTRAGCVQAQVALVRDLWDARSAAAEEQLAPRVSKEQLEEMTRRVRDANKVGAWGVGGGCVGPAWRGLSML